MEIQLVGSGHLFCNRLDVFSYEEIRIRGGGGSGCIELDFLEREALVECWDRFEVE